MTSRPHWSCTTCGKHYRIAYTPGVLIRVPTSMPEGRCRNMLAGIVPCEGEIVATNDAAREVEKRIAQNAVEQAPLMGPELEGA